VTQYLLDTHGLIWWWTDVKRLGAQARAAIESDGNRILVSVASVWEIAIKSHSGKLTAIEDFRRDYGPLMTRNGFASLSVRDDHALKAGFLKGEHRDPFDRLIAAQSLIEGVPLISRDPALSAFGCEVIW
jgi:PIN domain nuclease of toxin-antitoxin system